MLPILESKSFSRYDVYDKAPSTKNVLLGSRSDLRNAASPIIMASCSQHNGPQRSLSQRQQRMSTPERTSTPSGSGQIVKLPVWLRSYPRDSGKELYETTKSRNYTRTNKTVRNVKRKNQTIHFWLREIMDNRCYTRATAVTRPEHFVLKSSLDPT